MVASLLMIYCDLLHSLLITIKKALLFALVFAGFEIKNILAKTSLALQASQQ